MWTESSFDEEHSSFHVYSIEGSHVLFAEERQGSMLHVLYRNSFGKQAFVSSVVI